MCTLPWTGRISRPSTTSGGGAGVNGTVTTGCCACRPSRPSEYDTAATRTARRMSARSRTSRRLFRQHLFDPQLVFGIGSGLADLRCLERDAVLLLVPVLLGSPWVVRHVPD